MALGVYTECTKLWKLDELASIVDSVESYSNYIGIDNSAKTNGHELPLYLATCAFILIVGVACREFQLDDKYMNKELHDLAAFYIKSLMKAK